MLKILFFTATCFFLHSERLAAADSVTDRSAPEKIYQYSSQAMGTIVSVTIWTDNESAASKGAEAVFSQFNRIDSMMSSWVDTSELSMVNRSAGSKPVRIGEELYKVIKTAQRISKRTNGAFDITVGAYKGLWKFGTDKDGTIPSSDQIKERLSKVGYKRLSLLPKRHVRLRADTKITLGGIAKGYAIDEAVTSLREMGLVDFIIQAGGDMYAAGRRGDRPWNLGIRNPRGPRTSTIAVAPIKDMTFSTSGDYERFAIIDGVRYHHLLDPKTGMPAVRSQSVTVATKSALDADAWSTALFVMGPKKGMRLVKRTKNLEAVFISATGKLSVSPGLRRSVKFQKAATSEVP